MHIQASNSSPLTWNNKRKDSTQFEKQGQYVLATTGIWKQGKVTTAGRILQPMKTKNQFQFDTILLSACEV